MKNQAWRRQPSSYALGGELLPRFQDVDVWQHLNNGALIAMHGEVCQRWLRELLGAEAWRHGGGGATLIAPQAAATDFLAESHYPAALATGCRLLDVDDGGFRLATALFQQGRCVGLHEARMAAWRDGLPVALPATLAELLHAAAARQPVLPDGASVAPSAMPVPGPWPTLAGLPFRLALAARFADSDAHGQASDASLARYAEQTRVRLLGHVFGSGHHGAATGLMVGHVASRWLHRGRPPQDWQAGCGISRIGDRSMTVRGGLFAGDATGDRCVAVHDSVMVAIDRASHRSAPLPADWREALLGCRLPEAAPA